MTPETATEIIKQRFDIGDCLFTEGHNGMTLGIDLPSRKVRIDIDKFLLKSPEDLIYYFNRHWIKTEVQS